MRPDALLAVPALTLCVALAATAQAPSAPSAPAAAPPAPAETTGDEVSSLTCRDLFDLYAAAAPGEGKDPRALEKAQDDVLSFVLWVHGYLSGRDGIDFVKRPLNKAGIEKLVVEMGEACRTTPDRLFLEAVKGIR